MTPDLLKYYKPTTPDLATIVAAAFMGYIEALPTDEDTASLEANFLKETLPSILVQFRFRTPMCFYWVHSWIDYKLSGAANLSNKVLAASMLVRFLFDDTLPEPFHTEMENELASFVSKEMRTAFVNYLLDGMRGWLR